MFKFDWLIDARVSSDNHFKTMDEDLDVPLLLTESYGRVEENAALFEPMHVLGVGAYGIVELGVWAPLKTLVAIKRCVIDFDVLPRMRAEARALVMCKHPFVVRLLGILQHERTVFFVMTACTGGDLYFRFHFGMARDGVDAKERRRHAVFYLQEIVCALNFLHQRGVVHGDLKTENILIDAEGHVQLADFGSVASLKKGKEAFGLRGSTMHFPPEMVERQTYSLATDVWTLGCVAFELFTCSRPHAYSSCSGHTTMVGALEQHGVDAIAANFVRRLLDIDPLTRPSMAEVKKDALFHNVDWDAVEAKRVEVPWVPGSHINVEDEVACISALGVPNPAHEPLFYIVKPV